MTEFDRDYETKVLKKASKTSIEEAAKVLKAGQVAILPTDTIYGFSSVVGGGEEKIGALKHRRKGKSFIRLIGDVEDAKKISKVAIPDVLLSKWPGPLSVVLPLREGGTCCVRLPKDEWLRAVIKECGQMIYSTSVNIEGEVPLILISDIIEKWKGKVPLIVDGGDCQSTLASTIVAVEEEGGIRLLREGAIKV